MKKIILVMNAGSSSLKFKIYEDKANIASGQIERVGLSDPIFSAKDANGAVIGDKKWSDGVVRDHEFVLSFLVDWILGTFKGYEISACGHRVVHGGVLFNKATILDDKALNDLESVTHLAPLHNPNALRIIKLMRKLFPSMPQVGVFDTSFHQSMPEEATYYAIPYELYKEGVRRYGMHGTSYQYIIHKMSEDFPDFAKKRLVIAHIGSGASLCATNNGKCVLTTMGLTALEGVPMGTRAGSIDPGILLYLMENKNFGVDEIRDFLYHKSGMLGLSGYSPNFYALEMDIPKKSEAARAYGFMTTRTAEEIARLMVASNGCDGIVFTAGVGENSSYFRSEVCKKLAYLGIKLDDAKNEKRGEAVISSPDSKIKIFTIPTNEELMIALETKALVAQ
ncbi:MAG: acetate/propionate family kinase [Helicobacter sp.]|nr:acetate/propionate family kinase [Helicobacter sp.]